MTRIICNAAARNMIQRTILICLPFIIFPVMFASCASTKITRSWKDKEYKGKAGKIVVVMVAGTSEMRKMFEGRFVAELRARGNSAVQSHTLVTLEQLPDLELLKTKVQSTEADTVLISRLVDSKAVKAYQPGSVQTDLNINPGYYDGWGTYYGEIFMHPGYTTDTQVVSIETNLYDVKSEELIWYARTETERTEGEQQLVNTFIKVIVKKLSSDRIIK